MANTSRNDLVGQLIGNACVSAETHGTGSQLSDLREAPAAGWCWSNTRYLQPAFNPRGTAVPPGLLKPLRD
jgi:hypothetical protein